MLPVLFPAENNQQDNEKIEDIAKQLLQNPAFETLILKHLKNEKNAIEKQNVAFSLLKSDMNQMQLQLNYITSKNARLAHDLNRCCQKQFIPIEEHVNRILADLIGKPGISRETLSAWLHTIFVAKQDLEIKLSQLTKNVHEDIDNLIHSSAKQIMDDVTLEVRKLLNQQLDLSSNSNKFEGGLTEVHIRRIVNQVLSVYDADKTGLVDYALESSGGQVLSTRCTESYNAKTATLTVLGIPLWYPTNTPRTVINPDVVPGKCWAFQGFPGFIVIQLTANVSISAFSLEHIPKSLSPNGIRDSAPKGFTVYGLTHENDNEPFLLGKYEYDHDGPGLQYFTVQNQGHAFDLIELIIDSNHGNMIYTCLYRFRVHGDVQRK